ncbi:MAG: hypothetical protein KC414_11885, partial [Romboutsia sp.]|nr:hypothetical protein [Romboutsia sp.]
MRLIDKVEQSDGPGGTLETWKLDNKLLIGLWKGEKYYNLFIEDSNRKLYTEYIFDKLNHPYNELVMEYGSFFPPKIEMEHKYFDKFISLVEKLSIEDLTPDPFCG